MNGFGDRVLANPGVRAGNNSGRLPDIGVTVSELHGRVVWIEPAKVLLAIEIVSPGSTGIDRYIKPREYAAAGIPNFWLVEHDGPATVHMFGLNGSAASYAERGMALLDDLLSGPVPDLTVAG